MGCGGSAVMDLEPIEERAEEFATWVGKFDSEHRIPAAFASAADVPSLLAEVKRLRAEVTRLEEDLSDRTTDLAETTHPARPAPAWDEEAMRAARDEYVRHNLGMAVGTYGDRLRCAFEAGVDAVREHLPVKVDREAVARALAEHRLMGGRCRCGLDPRLDYYRYEQHVTDAVLDLWPGESRATVQAEALRDVVEKYAVTIPDALGYKVPAVMTEDLLARADRLGGSS